MTLDTRLKRIADRHGIARAAYRQDDEEAIAAMLAGTYPVSSNRYADLVRRAHSFREFDEPFELLCRDFLESHIQILDHQIEAARAVFTQMNLRAILADEVGLGKTIETGIIAKELEVRGMLENMLVLAPTTIMGQWVDEFREKFEMDLKDVYASDPLEREKGGYWIANSRAWHRKDSAVRRFVLEKEWDLVVVDEAHHFKNRRTKGFQMLDSAGHRGIRHTYMLLLTATPVQNDLKELYSLIHLVRPGALGSYLDFKQAHFGDSKGQAVRDAQRLREVVLANMVRNRRIDCGIDYRNRQPETHRLEFPAPVERVYRALFSLDGHPFQKVSWLRRASSSVAALVESLTNTPTLRHDPAHEALWQAVEDHHGLEPKAERLIEIAAAEPRTVVFTEFLRTQETLKRALEDAGLLVHELHGGMNGNRRREQVRGFRDRGGVFLSLPAGSEGLNLQFCNVIVNYDLPWNPMKVEQRIGRVDRIGQDRVVHVHALAYRGSIEDYILETLYRKLDMFRMCVGEIDNLFTTGTGDEEFELEGSLIRFINEDGTLEGLRRYLDEVTGRLALRAAEPAPDGPLAAEVLDA